MNRLNEVDVIRPISITLVILTHCFAIYTGAWTNPDSKIVPIVEEYKLLNQILVSFRMPAVVLVAGYIYAYFYEKKSDEKISDIIKIKFKRLILPSFIFGYLYILFFIENYEIKDLLLKLTSGVAHFWFLPMLFWNFIIGYYTIKFKFNKFLVLIVLFFIGILSSLLPNYLGFSIGLKFSPFFYIGIILMKKRNKVFKILNNKLYLILIFIAYILLLYLNYKSMPWILFIITTILSWILTTLFLKTKTGKYLLG